MLRLNLLPHRAQRRARQRRLFMVLLLSLASAALLLALVVGWRQHASIVAAQQQLAVLRAQSTAFDARLASRTALQIEVGKLQAQQDGLAQLAQARQLPAQLLAELAQQAPQELRLTRLSQQGEQLLLEGQVSDQQVLGQFVQQLEGAGVGLHAPKVVELRQPQAGKLDALAFTLELKLRYGAPAP